MMWFPHVSVREPHQRSLLFSFFTRKDFFNTIRRKQTSNIAEFVKRKTPPEGGELAGASNCDLPHGTSRNADLACSIRRCGRRLVPSSHDRRQDMEFEKIEVRPLTEYELDVISGGLDCDISSGPYRAPPPYGPKRALE
jgi:hypothetical protein